MSDSQLDRAIGIAFLIAASFAPEFATKVAMLFGAAVFYWCGRFGK